MKEKFVNFSNKVYSVVEKVANYLKDNEKTILGWFFAGCLIGGILVKIIA